MNDTETKDNNTSPETGTNAVLPGEIVVEWEQTNTIALDHKLGDMVMKQVLAFVQEHASDRQAA